MEMYGITTNVTKEMADRWLQTNPRNRSIKSMKLLKYKTDMIKGRFECTHQGIAIDQNGKLIDGHHRLRAISETGITTKLFVVFSAPESRYIDLGAGRTDRDSLYMTGLIEKGSVEYNQLVLPLRGFIMNRALGITTYRLSSSEDKHRVYLRFKNVIDQVIPITKKYSLGRMKSSNILYAMACAINDGVPAEVVERWYCIATTGDFFAEGSEELTKAGRSVLLFKNLVETTPARGLGDTEKEEILKKAESSIYHYYMLDPITKVYGKLFFSELPLNESDLA